VTRSDAAPASRPDATAAPWSDLSRPPLSQAALRASLTSGDVPAWRAVEVTRQTGSTNADLAERARGGEPAGLVVTTDDQLAGRGRLAREWTVPPRSSIAVSVLLAPTPSAERWGWLPLLAGVALVRTLTRIGGLAAVLKWPNDVLVPEPGGDLQLYKVSGILAEVVASPGGPQVVIGTGINVSQTRTELPVSQATSLKLAGAANIDRDTLLRAYLRELSTGYRAWQDADGDPRRSGLGAAYREACATIGRSVELHLPGREPLLGRCDGIDDDGRLLLLDGSGVVHAYAAGDVVHVRPAADSGADPGGAG
jgi:BirA family biotin operon repressor/biotin-[acetyl-CoA-carboxylase] ligase